MKQRRTQLSMRLLAGFAEVVRTGSTTAAGRELGLSQSAVSRLVTQLEAELGFELFWRDRGRLVLTKEGLRLAGEAELAIAGFERVQSLAEEIAGFAVGELRIVAPPSFSQAILPDIAARFRKRYPGVRLGFESRSVETARTMIATRVVDGGFLKLPADLPDITTIKVFSCDTVCVLPRRHELARSDTLSPADLNGVPLILLGARGDTRRTIEREFREAGTMPMVSVETTTVGSACAMVRNDLGIAIVNERLAAEFLDQDLTSVPFKPSIRQAYAFAHSSLSQPTRLASTFIDCVMEYFKG